MTKAYVCAVRLLARREHALDELTKKLINKGHSVQESKDAVLKCQTLDLQSNQRFAESLCYTRFQQGYGPLRITQELQAKHIPQDLIAQVLKTYQDQWEEQAHVVWQKKFKGSTVDLIADLPKQVRFLLYRGFPAEIATNVVNNLKKKEFI